MVPIRSWSGGRFLNEESDPRLFCSFDSDVINEKTSSFIEDDSFSTASSTSILYEDDFTDDGYCCDCSENMRCYNKDNEQSDKIKSTSDIFLSEDNDMFDLHQQQLITLEISESDQSSDTYSSSFDDEESGRCVTTDPKLKEEEGEFLHANVQYKKWLKRVQSAKRQKKALERILAVKTKEKLIKRRDLLVAKARNRKKIGYDCATIAAKHSRVERFKIKVDLGEGDTTTSSSLSKQEMKQRRKRYEHKHKKFLERLIEQRHLESTNQKKEERKAEVVRRRVTELVLDEIRRLKGNNESQSISNAHQATKYDNTAEQNDNNLPGPGLNNCSRICELKNRYTSQFNVIVIERQRKKEAAARLSRRLKRRADILRRKYEQHLTSNDKLWGMGSDTDNLKNTKREETITDLANRNKLVLTLSQAEALSIRLHSKKFQCEGLLFKENEETFNEWKVKHCLKMNQKVFSMTGWYPSIRDDLSDRGWFLNQDRDSNHFDLKFTLAASDIAFDALNEKQFVNHFRGSTCLTTKVGLVNTLHNCTFMAQYYSESKDFFPRSYNLSNLLDLHRFLDDYSCVQAMSSLQRLLERVKLDERTIINVKVLTTLISVIKKSTYEVDDSFIDSTGFVDEQCFSLIQGMIVQHADEWLYRQVHDDDIKQHESAIKALHKHLFVDVKSDMSSWDLSHPQRNRALKHLSSLTEISDDQIILINSTLEKYGDLGSYQGTINGRPTDNMWILKPGGKSRGRGISVIQTLPALVQHMITEPHLSTISNRWVIQKYIENPLIISKRKFDIRQWIMVTDWNPLTIWFNNECYIRFAVMEYEDVNGPGNQQWADNKYRHLVNNSIGKKSKDFTKTFSVEEINEVVEGYMWSLEKFKKWLIWATGKDLWELSLQSEIKEIVIDTILCAQEKMITERKRSWEVYGFDIMIDENYHPWLIEVNSSPACDYSTAVTETFIKRALPDVLKVILDTNDSKDVDHEQINTGGWERIYVGQTIPKVSIGFGIEMSLKGLKMSTKRHKNLEKRIPKKDDSKCDLVFDDSDLSDYEQKNKHKEFGFVQAKKEIEYSNNEVNKENNENGDKEKVKKNHKYVQRLKKQNNLRKIMVPLKKVTIGL